MKIVIAIGVLLLCCPVAAYTQKKTTVRPKPSPTPSLAIISFEAGLVYASGDVKPVARTAFFLLDSDLGQILFDAKLVPPKDARPADVSREQEQLVNAYAMAILHRSTSMERLEFYNAAQKLVPPHVVEVVETDFSGKATFKPLPPGKYFIVGISETRKSFAVWNHPVNAKAGQNVLILDQKNANFAE